MYTNQYGSFSVQVIIQTDISKRHPTIIPYYDPPIFLKFNDHLDIITVLCQMNEFLSYGSLLQSSLVHLALLFLYYFEFWL